MGTRLIDALGTTEAIEASFSDAALLGAMLEVETALARVEAQLGIIPADAASAVEAIAQPEHFDAGAIARQARASGSVVLPLVQALVRRARERGGPAGEAVHWGATSQDIADTAFNLCLARGLDSIAIDQQRIAARLQRLSDDHAGSIMLGRTLLQPAPPVTFGLKAAGWYAAIGRSWRRVRQARDEALLVQLGGASGTLAAFGENGVEAGERLAAELGLGVADAPWHTHRDRLAALACALGVYAGALGKLARDLSLLMQHEVAEASEPGGGSSTMPHKRNPAASAIALAAAARTPGLVATILAGMVQEHERAVGGWQAEWPTIVALVQACGSAAAALAEAVEGLSVDVNRMRKNLEATRGVVFAEGAMLRLTAAAGREAARALVERALAESQRLQRPFVDILIADREVTAHVPSDELRTLCSAEGYLGAAEALRLRLLGRAASAAVED